MPFKFGVDSSGNYGYYKAGADSVTPFKSGAYDVQYGTSGPFTITNSYQGRTTSGTITFKTPFTGSGTVRAYMWLSAHMVVKACSANTTTLSWTIYNTNSASAGSTNIYWCAFQKS